MAARTPREGPAAAGPLVTLFLSAALGSSPRPKGDRPDRNAPASKRLPRRRGA